MKTKHDISSGTCEDKTRIFLSFLFCSVLGLCLVYDFMLMTTTIFMSQAWLRSFVLPFVLTLCLYLCSSVNQALSLFITRRNSITVSWTKFSKALHQKISYQKQQVIRSGGTRSVISVKKVWKMHQSWVSRSGVAQKGDQRDYKPSVGKP